MNTDDILRAAIECQLITTGNRDGFYADALVRFANLVRTELLAEQEPVAWVVDMNGTESLEWHSDVQADLIFGTAVQPLYPEAPQPAKRVPLTREQAMKIVEENPDTMTAVRMTEAAHGITGETK